ncbi:hypothetical protein BT69DRAFT_1377560 [Atractiella rhizophila]|nr:hypothetical protein BT69DRAFT_1377560 [Atractiella rhizophila]
MSVRTSSLETSEPCKNCANRVKYPSSTSSGEIVQARREKQQHAHTSQSLYPYKCISGTQPPAADDSLAQILDLTAARSKAPFKTTLEVDNQIKSLEKRIESATVKLVEEEWTLTEISLRRPWSSKFAAPDSYDENVTQFSREATCRISFGFSPPQ